MFPQKKVQHSNPLQNAGIFSQLFMCWLSPLLHLGHKRRLEESDLYHILPQHESELLGQNLQRFWDVEVKKATKELRKPKLTKVLLKCYGKSYAVAGLFAFSLEAIKVIQPLLLGKIILFFENYDPEDRGSLLVAYGCAGAMCLSTFALTLLQHLYYYFVQRIGMNMRVAVCHVIYCKALRLSSQAMGQTTTGQIVNLLSNDINRFDEITLNLHYLWVGPLQAAVIITLLWYEIGPSCLAGVAVLALLIPVQTWFGKLFGIFRSKTAVLTDSRIRIMNEVVSGIRIIKMYAWEKPFSALIAESRRKEINQIMKSSYLRGLNMASFFASSKIVVFATFAVYAVLGNIISASRVFVTMSLYGTIKITVTLFFPLAIEKVSETIVSIRRIKNFLMLNEMSTRKLTLENKNPNCIEMKMVNCYWDKFLDAPSLQNITLTVKSQQLLAVIGPVGAGKSSLLSAILGELPHESGMLTVRGQLNYASQQPWVFPGSIRSNILFGRVLDPHKYERVLRACALKKDLELFPDGDMTLIGDKGGNLSGGQKARINLARAVYEEADIYLLDDPLSAVDAEVGKYLFEACICGLLKNKCRILVTHQLQHLRTADQIVVVKEGHMIAQGTYSELQSSGLDVGCLLKSTEEQEQQSWSANCDAVSLASRWTNHSNSSLHSHSSLLPPACGGYDQLTAENVHATMEETRAEGNVSNGIYIKYFTAHCHPLVLLAILLLSIVAEAAYIVQDWWLVFWANHSTNDTSNSTVGAFERGINKTASHAGTDLPFYLGIYSGLTAAAVILGYVRSLVIFHGLVKSTQTLHNRMFNAVLRTPVYFFDINPIGRILNRFSKDISQMDSMLPLTFVDFYQLFWQNVGVIAVASSIIPYLLIAIAPLLFVFLYLRRFYLSTSRDIKRLESTTRSPVFSHLSSSLQGLWSIRAFGAEERLTKAFDSYQDRHSEAWFLFLMTSRWFALRLDSICSVFITFATFGCIFLRDGLEPGEVGLVLTYAVTLVGHFQWTVRQSAELENTMTSVERVVEYTNLKSEAPWETSKRCPPNWPSQGQVTFDHVHLSYSAEAPVILKDICATFCPNEKVGIVGRTGAGKSSLVAALFRLAEPQGNIYIDGVLTSELGLHDLRQKISIIPQDPVLFTDSVRKNLDPFNQHSDADVWKALEQVQLKCMVKDLPTKLETVLAECGSNFSVGQRQLVCLARAILRKNRILVIDEATANVDPRTDELIQQTIRQEFKDCTVFTIAHRLNTIIDSDRILVLDEGRVQEFGHPSKLLQNKDGALHRLVQQLGPTEAEALLEAAKKAVQTT
ncbi:ATP-binding cassette sub-family C member 4-like [Nerophis ophidion]|uniref:ATP-binding cassette sub-family C member 4-like n=1 Tax=Nerophis ophidion TaxID=159077 RepID=UPI002ADF1C59|nr:ATP-binding cassette sub-family C member 4-like [Nerophis ophidion]